MKKLNEAENYQKKERFEASNVDQNWKEMRLVQKRQLLLLPHLLQLLCALPMELFLSVSDLSAPPRILHRFPERTVGSCRRLCSEPLGTVVAVVNLLQSSGFNSDWLQFTCRKRKRILSCFKVPKVWDPQIILFLFFFFI